MLMGSKECLKTPFLNWYFRALTILTWSLFWSHKVQHQYPALYCLGYTNKLDIRFQNLFWSECLDLAIGLDLKSGQTVELNGEDSSINEKTTRICEVFLLKTDCAYCNGNTVALPLCIIFWLYNAFYLQVFFLSFFVSFWPTVISDLSSSYAFAKQGC